MRGAACGALRVDDALAAALTAAEPGSGECQKIFHGDFDEEALLENVDGKDDTVGIGGIVDEAFEAVEWAADNFHASADGEERHHAHFVAGGDDGFDVGELAEKSGLVGDGDGSGEEVLLVDAVFFLERDAGKDVAGEERLGEFFRLLGVVADTDDEREIVLKAFGGHERGEFLFAAGLGVADEPLEAGQC